MAIFRDEHPLESPGPGGQLEGRHRFGGSGERPTGGSCLWASHAPDGREFMSFGFYGFRNHFIASEG
jgi:hypothetical protein